MGRKVFIFGGARSGKSQFAQSIIKDSGFPATYCATAEALDDEMRRRIDRHKKDRPHEWPTLEAPYLLPQRLAEVAEPGRALLLDCLAVYTSNAMLAQFHAYHDAMTVSQVAQAEQLIISEVKSALKNLGKATLAVVVSNEVGLSLVPDNVLGRAYRDILGRVNQAAAQWADEVYFVVCGIPMMLKHK